MRYKKLFILFAFFLFIILGYYTYDKYKQIQNVQKLIILNESKSISKFVLAFRQTYQDIFIRNNIRIDEKTIDLLPVKAITEIGKRYKKSIHNSIVIRTVSDRPRNIKNMANSFEMEMIEYFKTNPNKIDKFVKKDDSYYYTRPIYIKKSCLVCHGNRDNAPPRIRKLYNKAYDYKVGEIRGLINIKIKERHFFNKMYRDFITTIIITILIYFLFLLTIYKLMQKIQKSEKDYTKKLEEDIETKIYEIKKQKEILKHQAQHDTLTGLPNRSLFNDRLNHGIIQAKRHNRKLALLFIDLDNFKQINDTLGHQAGDKVLLTVTERLKSKIRAEDTIARLGGDEFTIIIEDIKKLNNISILCKKILNVIEEPIYINDHTFYVSCSIGISLYPEDDTDAHNLVKYADAAMYKAKEEGRNNFQFYSSEMTVLAYKRVVMEANLREALTKNEFIVYYQLQVDAKSGKLVGLEGLIRWNNPKEGLIFPGDFIPIAEETGLIIDIDRWVMQTAMKQMSIWYKRGFNPGVLALNLSMKQLDKDDFIDVLKNCMKENEFNPQWLELEISEGEVMQNPEKSIVKLKEISSMGIEIAIDDFGTGYSSLSYLKKLPVNTLKIDQSLVRGLPEDKEDVSIVKAIIALANSFNLNMIAEGVETKAQKDFIEENGCNYIQGYYYGKPMSALDIENIYLPKTIE